MERRRGSFQMGSISRQGQEDWGHHGPDSTPQGGRGMSAVDRCLDFIDENGDARVDIWIKHDTEEAMKVLVRSIQEERVE
eukprot:11995899-Karenia_brevis.AAC.1